MDPLGASQPAVGPDVPPTALVVEDDEAAKAAIVRLLKASGFEVQTAANGLDGIDAVGKADYNVIISDVRMPGLGGIGFFQQLEEFFPTFARRVIFVTAYSGSPDVLAFLKLTGQPFFQKPYDPSDLLNAAKGIACRPLFRRSSISDSGPFPSPIRPDP